MLLKSIATYNNPKENVNKIKDEKLSKGYSTLKMHLPYNLTQEIRRGYPNLI